MKYVVSDIHGNIKAFNDILRRIHLTDNDTLYVLGDVIDRGEHGIEILQRVINSENMKMLIGNHEYMMLEALGYPYEQEEKFTKDDQQYAMELWFYNGGGVTFDAFKKLSKNDKIRMIEFLKGLPLNFYDESNGESITMIHAMPELFYDAHADVLGKEYPKGYFCVWDRDYIFNLNNLPVGKVIFGHTPTINLQNANPMSIYQNGTIIGIDCGAAYGRQFGGRLSCIRLDDMKVFYSEVY